MPHTGPDDRIFSHGTLVWEEKGNNGFRIPQVRQKGGGGRRKDTSMSLSMALGKTGRNTKLCSLNNSGRHFCYYGKATSSIREYGLLKDSCHGTDWIIGILTIYAVKSLLKSKYRINIGLLTMNIAKSIVRTSIQPSTTNKLTNEQQDLGWS